MWLSAICVSLEVYEIKCPSILGLSGDIYSFCSNSANSEEADQTLPIAVFSSSIKRMIRLYGLILNSYLSDIMVSKIRFIRTLRSAGDVLAMVIM